VCVAAVDLRWITHCLGQAPGLIDRNSNSELDTYANNKSELEEEVGVPATAADYLEKIFQIPLWLRPVPLEQRGAIARTLLDPSESSEEVRFDLPVTSLYKVIPTRPAQPQGPEGDDDVPGGESVDPDIISQQELEFLDKLGGLLDGNPRSLKRFVNTYRLVKTALSDVELTVFLRDLLIKDGEGTATYSPYRICMGQLAVLCTQRNRALKLVRFADQATEITNFSDWLTGFASTDEDLANRFRTAFREDLEGMDVHTFKLWLERTRRYSFYL
jgi:hypothetical protein